MKKFIIKIYLIITLLILFLSTITLISFNIADLIRNEKNNIITALNIIENSYENIEESHINNILNEFNLKIDIMEKNKDINLKKYTGKKEIEKNSNNLYDDFLYNNKNLYYIKEYEQNIIFLYKYFNITQILIRDGLICITIILIIAIIIYIFLKK